MIPKEFIEQIHAELPSTESVDFNSINKEFTYNGKYYAINFYKVEDKGQQFWLYNRDNIVDVFVNGSQIVKG